MHNFPSFNGCNQWVFVHVCIVVFQLRMYGIHSSKPFKCIIESGCVLTGKLSGMYVRESSYCAVLDGSVTCGLCDIILTLVTTAVAVCVCVCVCVS